MHSNCSVEKNGVIQFKTVFGEKFLEFIKK